MKRLLGTLCVFGFLFHVPAHANTEDATKIVTEAYQDVFGRKPDSQGLREYRSKVIEKGWTAERIRKDLRKSNEYLDKEITQAYMDVLGRKPDQAGLDNYREKLRNRGWQIKGVRNELRKSPEYKQKAN